MRVVLDAHVSSRHIGRPLTTAGHVVLALDQDQALGRLPDEKVLALGAEEGRILVTHNISDFVPIARTWAEGGRSHPGLILVTSRPTAYGAILRGLQQAFAARPAQDGWIDRVEFLGRAP